MIQASNKEALNIALNFFKGNVALSLAAIAVLLVIALLKEVPVIGIIFALVYPILSFAIQIYVAREIPRLQRPEEMGTVAQRTKLGELFTRHLDIAAGGFLGFFLILMLLGMLFAGLMSASIDVQTAEQAMQTQNVQEMIVAISTGGALGTLFFFLILMMWLGYLMPGVMGEVLLAPTFMDAFRKSFLLFNPRFWKRTFTKEYFILILIWSFIVFFAATLFSWIAVSIILLPVALVGVYFLSLYNATIYVFAQEALSRD